MSGVFGIAVMEKQHSFLQESRFRVGKVFGYLGHPSLVGAGGDARNMDFAVQVADEEENVIGDEPEGGQGFPGEKVGGGQVIPMDVQELPPSQLPHSAGGWGNAVPFQDILDGFRIGLKPQKLQSSHKGRVTVVWVFQG